MTTSRTGIALRTIAELTARDLLPIVRDVCRQHGVTLEEVCGTLRTRSIVLARREVWWRVRNHPERHYSVDDVSRIFGKGNSTVDEGIRAHARRLAATTDRPKDVPLLTMATSRTSIAELTARDVLPVIHDVCRRHGVTLEEVCGTLVSRSITRARLRRGGT
jgi:hypothetical protein